MMKKFLIFALLALGCGSMMQAQQTMWVHQGNVHWAYNTDTVGTMPYASGTRITVLEKVFNLSEVDSITVDNQSIADNTVKVTYSGNTAQVIIAGNVARDLTASVSGAHVTVLQDADVTTEITYSLSGTSSNGSFYQDGSYKITLELNGVNLTCADSAAINIQDGKRIDVSLVDGTTNSLADGTSSSAKAAFYINGHSEFKNGGSLTLTGGKKHAFHGDEYVILKKTVGTITVNSATKDGFSVNQYFQMNGGTLIINNVGDDAIQVDKTNDATDANNGMVIINGGTITASTSAASSKVINAEGDVQILGGTLNLTNTGAAAYNSTDLAIKSACCIKSDADVTINGSAAQLTLVANGNGARGISCDSIFTLADGNVDITCNGALYAYGTTDTAKVNCVKADVQAIVSGGSMEMNTAKDEGMGLHSKGVLTVSGGTLTCLTYDHGIKANTNATISGGTINFTVTGTASKGISCDGDLNITGGTITGTVSGGGETVNNEASACAGIKVDGDLTIDNGTLNLTATGAGGKGINVDGNIVVNGGTITASTTGARYGSSSSGGGGWNPWGPGGDVDSEGTCSAKGIRCEGNLTINGGTFNISATGGEGSEGIETKMVMTINGGYIYANTYDDALNSSSHMYIKGGYIYAVATNNDAIDSNGNMYLSGGMVFCYGSEEGFDANSEGGYQVYVQSGACFAAIGGSMGAVESGASLSQSCYQTTASSNTWYALYNGSTVKAAFKTPTLSSSGGGWGPGGGGSSGSTMVVTSPSCKLYSGVTGSGTSIWNGNGYTSASGGSQVSLSSYSGGSGW